MKHIWTSVFLIFLSYNMFGQQKYSNNFHIVWKTNVNSAQIEINKFKEPQSNFMLNNNYSKKRNSYLGGVIIGSIAGATIGGVMGYQYIKKSNPCEPTSVADLPKSFLCTIFQPILWGVGGMLSGALAGGIIDYHLIK